jgi:hypothetical protein
MRIHCFGASVTAQGTSRNGEITGYVDHLAALCKEQNLTIERFAFGSCQFFNMGRFGFSSSLELDPDVIIFEWHTTGEKTHNISQWISLIRICLQKGIFPIILVLPRRDIEKSLQKYQILSLLKSVALVIDLTEGINSDELFRDVVHTTPKGAAVLARIIYKYIIKYILSERAFLMKFNSYKAAIGSFSTHNCHVQYSYHSVPDNLSSLSQTSRLVVGLSATSDIAIWGTKDSSIGDIKIWEPLSTKRYVYHVFDQWCHYSRDSLFLAHNSLSKVFIIELTWSRPLYSLICPKLDILGQKLDDDNSFLKNVIKGFYIREGLNVNFASGTIPFPFT